MKADLVDKALAALVAVLVLGAGALVLHKWAYEKGWSAHEEKVASQSLKALTEHQEKRSENAKDATERSTKVKEKVRVVYLQAKQDAEKLDAILEKTKEVKDEACENFADCPVPDDVVRLLNASSRLDR